MRTPDADVIICGGSLAGAAAAIRLCQHGLTPMVIEQKRFPRKKLCGEFLGPDSFNLLQALGMWETVQNLGYGPIERAVFYTMAGKPLLIRMAWLNQTYPYGFGMTRESLDWAMLAHAKSLGAVVLEETKVLSPITQVQEVFHVTTLSSNAKAQEGVFRAPVVIDASGRQGGLYVSGYKRTEREATPNRPIGIKVNVSFPQPNTDKTLHMFFFPGGYGGIQPLTLQTANVCMVAPANTARQIRRSVGDLLDITMGQNPVAARMLEGCSPIEPVQTVANLAFNLKRPDATGLIRVGDAMAAIDPFTGSGMTMALQTGLLAADAIAEGIRRKQPYETIKQACTNRYQARYGLRLRLLRGFHPYLFSTALQNITVPILRPFLPLLARSFR